MPKLQPNPVMHTKRLHNFGAGRVQSDAETEEDNNGVDAEWDDKSYSPGEPVEQRAEKVESKLDNGQWSSSGSLATKLNLNPLILNIHWNFKHESS
jgi:hypothetical protein